MKNLIKAAIMLLILVTCSSGRKQDQVVWLSNGTLKIGILPTVGGRMVWASLKGSDNLLFSDSTLWNEPAENRPSMNPTKPFKGYNGHINWLSPQSEWWVKQDEYPELKERKSTWPPDPYLIYTPYKITKRSKKEITLEGPESPFTKVKMIKTYRLDGDKIELIVRAQNTSSEDVNWGLWFNTRMNGWDTFFIPGDSTSLKKANMAPGKKEEQVYNENGLWNYIPQKPDQGRRGTQNKLFFDSPYSTIAATRNNQWLIIQAPKVDHSAIHPEQNQIEIYIENSNRPERDILELEMHFEYKTIKAGETIEATEIWHISPSTPNADRAALQQELKTLLKDLD